MKKTGILGGTFDPIHMGHLILAQAALDQFSLDEVMLMPAAQPPHKAEKQITPADLRLQMTAAAIADNDRLVLSDFEMQRKGNSYTYQTLDLLHRAYPYTDFYFIMGADSLRDFADWRYPERIAKSCVILAANRDDAPDNELRKLISQVQQAFDADVRLLTIPGVELSSSDLRRRVQQGHSIRYLTLDPVLRIIEENHLYRV